MSDLRNRIPPSGPFVVDTNSRPIIGSGGDQSQAQDIVAPATPTDLITLPVDTTGTKIAGMFALFTAQVKLASTMALAKCRRRCVRKPREFSQRVRELSQ